MSQYWYYYSSEEFSALIYKVKFSWTPEEHDPDFASHYHGPYKTITECRAAIEFKIKGDIDEFKDMLRAIRCKPTVI